MVFKPIQAGFHSAGLAHRACLDNYLYYGNHFGTDRLELSRSLGTIPARLELPVDFRDFPPKRLPECVLELPVFRQARAVYVAIGCSCAWSYCNSPCGNDLADFACRFCSDVALCVLGGLRELAQPHDSGDELGKDFPFGFAPCLSCGLKLPKPNGSDHHRENPLQTRRD